MKPNPITKEIFILISITLIVLFVSWMVCWAFFSKTPYPLDIQLHDSFFVISWDGLTIPVLLLVIAATYAIKESLHRYRRKFQNLVLLTCVFLINIELLGFTRFAYNLVSQIGISNKGWTIYPPLSALPKAHPLPSPSFNHLIQILLLIQIFFMLLLVIIAIITGINWINKREN